MHGKTTIKKNKTSHNGYHLKDALSLSLPFSVLTELKKRQGK
jgi:hypothetical protein